MAFALFPRLAASFAHLSVAQRSRFSIATARLAPMYSEAETSLNGSMSSNDKKSTATAIPVSEIIPRAAVSVVARHVDHDDRVKYVLVQRGKEPNKGMWSLPGGKIEPGEKSLAAAKRELFEETGLGSELDLESELQSSSAVGADGIATKVHDCRMEWSEDGPICITDSIHMDNDTVQFHYAISQWFVNVINDRNDDSDKSDKGKLPTLVASDDAEDAKWFDLQAIQRGVELGQITNGVEKVVLRSEFMYEKGVL